MFFSKLLNTKNFLIGLSLLNTIDCIHSHSIMMSNEINELLLEGNSKVMTSIPKTDTLYFQDNNEENYKEYNDNVSNKIMPKAIDILKKKNNAKESIIDSNNNFIKLNEFKPNIFQLQKTNTEKFTIIDSNKLLTKGNKKIVSILRNKNINKKNIDTNNKIIIPSKSKTNILHFQDDNEENCKKDNTSSEIIPEVISMLENNNKKKSIINSNKFIISNESKPNIFSLQKSDVEEEENKKEDEKEISIIKNNSSSSSHHISEFSCDDDNNTVLRRFSEGVRKYKKMNNDLHADLQDNPKSISLQPTLTTVQQPSNFIRSQKRKQSNMSCGSNASFINPIDVSMINTAKKLELKFGRLNQCITDRVLIPIIMLQADGLQTIDTDAHLLAFNELYSFNNFGTNPYIYCASSASILGLSMAFDLQKGVNPAKNLLKIGKKLAEDASKFISNNVETNSNNTSFFNCSLSSIWRSIKLAWFSVFKTCIKTPQQTIVDSIYEKIPQKTLDDILDDILKQNENVEVPTNLIIKDVDKNLNIIDQVRQANNNQNRASQMVQITSVIDPIASFLKKFIDCETKDDVVKGINFVQDGIGGQDLIRITSQDEVQFIQNNNLDVTTENRTAIIINSNVDNSNRIFNDMTAISLKCKGLEEIENTKNAFKASEDTSSINEEREKLENKNTSLPTLKVNLCTINSVIGPNYSLNKKYNNVKEILNKSPEFTHLIKILPQPTSLNSSEIAENWSNNSSGLENVEIEGI